MLAIREYITGTTSPEQAKKDAGNIKISMKNFEAALKKVKPSANREAMKSYEKLAEDFARQVTDIEEETEEKLEKSARIRRKEDGLRSGRLPKRRK